MDVMKNHKRAREIVSEWPEWKQQFALTKHSVKCVKPSSTSENSSPCKENSKDRVCIS